MYGEVAIPKRGDKLPYLYWKLIALAFMIIVGI